MRRLLLTSSLLLCCAPLAAGCSVFGNGESDYTGGDAGGLDTDIMDAPDAPDTEACGGCPGTMQCDPVALECVVCFEDSQCASNNCNTLGEGGEGTCEPCTETSCDAIGKQCDGSDDTCVLCFNDAAGSTDHCGAMEWCLERRPVDGRRIDNSECIRCDDDFDADNDGFPNPACGVRSTDDHFEIPVDCDDTNASVHPGLHACGATCSTMCGMDGCLDSPLPIDRPMQLGVPLRVAAGVTGENVSLAIDSMGQVHVAYIDMGAVAHPVIPLVVAAVTQPLLSVGSMIDTPVDGGATDVDLARIGGNVTAAIATTMMRVVSQPAGIDESTPGSLSFDVWDDNGTVAISYTDGDRLFSPPTFMALEDVGVVEEVTTLSAVIVARDDRNELIAWHAGSPMALPLRLDSDVRPVLVVGSTDDERIIMGLDPTLETARIECQTDDGGEPLNCSADTSVTSLSITATAIAATRVEQTVGPTWNAVALATSGRTVVGHLASNGSTSETPATWLEQAVDVFPTTTIANPVRSLSMDSITLASGETVIAVAALADGESGHDVWLNVIKFCPAG